MLVDDGLATGSTMAAAVQALRQRSARRVVVAVPVGSAPGCRALREHADQVLCLLTPARFQTVGQCAALAGHDPINQQLGAADQRVPSWFRAFGGTAPTGYLRDQIDAPDDN